MAYFDRFDICEAHHVLEIDYNVGGILHERPSNRRRNASTGVQLSRMRFKPSLSVACSGFQGLTDNGRDIYMEAVERLHLPRGD